MGGGVLEKHEKEEGAQTERERERWVKRDIYLYTYILKTIRCNISEKKKTRGEIHNLSLYYREIQAA